MTRAEVQFRIATEAYRRLRQRHDREAARGETMGDLLARALDDFFDEIERGGGTFDRRPPSGGAIRRAKLAVDDSVRDRLQRTVDALKASKEELIRQAVGRLVDWY